MTTETPFPEKIRFNERQQTKYYNSTNNIQVRMTDYPRGDFRRRCYDMIMSTWQDDADYMDKEVSKEEIQKVFNELLSFKVLPNSMETLVFSFRVDGLTHIEISHLLRHRTFFGIHAQCSGDRFLQTDSVFIPSSIFNSKFRNEYMRMTENAKALYCDMVDSKEVSLMDARYVLTRNHRYFYFFSANLKDLMAFVNQRKCTMVQPEMDNVLAHKILYYISRIIPEIKNFVSLECDKRCHFLNSPLERNTRLYQLDEPHAEAIKNNPEHPYNDPTVFLYDKTRKQMGIKYEQR